MHIVYLNLKGIGKVFSGVRLKKETRTLFTGINLEIKKGETFGIMGDSGIGKTTLGKIMVGLEKPTWGNVFYKGKNISEMTSKEWKQYRRKVQMVFQDPEGSLNPRKTIKRSLNDVLRLINCPEEQVEEVIERSFLEVGLNREILDRYPSQLSGGMNQRVALARILLLNPELIVLDEPTSALDLTIQAQILYLLQDLQKEKNLSYVFISHDEKVINFMSQRQVILRDGKLIRRKRVLDL